MDDVKCKYVAILVKGCNYWLWFETAKVKVEDGIFNGRAGWGKDGVFTDINIDTDLIVGTMESDTLNYV